MNAISLVMARSNPAMGGNALTMLLSGCVLLTALAFIAAAIGVLKGLGWGREMMVAVSAIAILLVLGGIGLQWSVNDPTHQGWGLRDTGLST